MGNKFSVDYSKHGTAKCKACVKVIAKNELRIGKLVPFKNVYIKQYYHMDCAFGSFQKARVVTNVISNVYEIDGFDHINAVDKSHIINLFDNHKNVRKLPLPKALPTKKTLFIQTPVKSRKSNLKLSSLPSINVMFTNADHLTPSKLA